MDAMETARRGPSRARCSILGALAATATLVSGCATHRELVIDSSPPGAMVRLDDEIVGTTPYHTAFDAFGTRRLTLYHAGYKTYSDLVELKAPWYAQFPFDFFSEVLIPVGWHYRKAVNVLMEHASGEVLEPDLQAVLERAEALRKAGPEGPTPARRPAAHP